MIRVSGFSRATTLPVSGPDPLAPSPPFRATCVISMECWAGGFCYTPPAPHFHNRTRRPAVCLLKAEAGDVVQCSAESSADAAAFYFAGAHINFP